MGRTGRSVVAVPGGGRVVSGGSSCCAQPAAGPSSVSSFVFRAPDNVILGVMSHLSGKEVARAMCLNKEWYRAGSDDQNVWRRVFESEFGECGVRQPGLTWRQMCALEVEWRSKGYVYPKMCEPPPINGTAGINCMDFNDVVIIAGDETGLMHVWDAKNYRHKGCVWLGRRHTVATCLGLSGTKVVSGCEDWTIRVWDTEKFECVGMLKGHLGRVLCVNFDGRLAVSGAQDSTVKVWDVDAKRCLATLRGHVHAIHSLQFVGRIIVSASDDRTIKVWDMKSGQCVELLEALEVQGSVNHVQFDGERIVVGISGEGFQCIEVWTVGPEECRKIHTIYTSNLACFSVDGMRIVGRKVDSRKLCMWDLKSGARILTLGEHEDGVECLAVKRGKMLTAWAQGSIVIKEWVHHSKLRRSKPRGQKRGVGSAGTSSNCRRGCIASREGVRRSQSRRQPWIRGVLGKKMITEAGMCLTP